MAVLAQASASRLDSHGTLLAYRGSFNTARLGDILVISLDDLVVFLDLSICNMKPHPPVIPLAQTYLCDLLGCHITLHELRPQVSNGETLRVHNL